MFRPQCILCVIPSSYCSQSSRRSKLRREGSPTRLRSGVIMCAWCSCFSSSPKQSGPEMCFCICLLLLQLHRISSQWMDPTIPGGFWFYIADVDQLYETHTAVHEEFMSGNLSIRRSTQPFAQVWSDMALEQSINIDRKTTGGIIGINKSPGSLTRWFLVCYERAAITTAIPCCCTLICEIKQYYYEGHVCFTRLTSTWYTQRVSTGTDAER